MTLFLWVTIKICRTTRSIFALTLQAFTPLLAITLIYLALEKNFKGWIGLIFGFFVASIPIQSWLFAMQYLKSYLYTCVGGDSQVYKIHTVVKYIVTITYAVVLIYFDWRFQP